MHQPTLRVLQVLQRICQGDQPRLAELSRSLSIPKSTLVPILQTLCQQQYLHVGEGGRYSPGAAIFQLCAHVKSSLPVLELVREQLDTLVQALDETCYFGVLEGGDVLYLQKVESTQPLRMLTAVGHRLPAYATGIGKALLCELDSGALEQLYPEPLQKLTEHTLTDRGALRRQLDQARQDGYAWECEESTPHVRCFAVPVRKHGRAVAAVSITIPLFRYDESKRTTILTLLRTAAESIGAQLEQTDAHFGAYF